MQIKLPQKNQEEKLMRGKLPLLLNTGKEWHDQCLTSLPQVDEKAETWADKNKWFGKNKPMTYTAFDHHKDLVEDEGMDPTSDEYYAEIDKRMKLDFPHKFDTRW